MNDDRHVKLRALKRSFEAIECGLQSIARAQDELNQLIDEVFSPDREIVRPLDLLIDASIKAKTARAELSSAIMHEANDTYKGWCGHVAKCGHPLKCGCGQGPF